MPRLCLPGHGPTRGLWRGKERRRVARNSSFAYKGQSVDVKQVGRDLGVRYVLEGSVRKAGTQVRITGQLIDALTGTHLWADRFDGSLEDVFELQDKVAISVAGVIEPTLEAAEIRRAVERPTADLTAYDLYLRAIQHIRTSDKDQTLLALDLLARAIEIDPYFGPALAFSALSYVSFDPFGWTDDREAKGVVRQQRFDPNWPHLEAWARRLKAMPGFALPYDLIPSKDREFDPV